MNIVKNLFPNSTIKHYEEKINLLGCENKLKVDSFLLSRLFIELILFKIFCLLNFSPNPYIVIVLIKNKSTPELNQGYFWY